MLNINIVTGVSELEIDLPIIEEKDILKYNGECFAGVDFNLILTPIQPQLGNHSYFTPILTFSISKEIDDNNENILFRIKAGIGFELKNFHIFTNIDDLEDCIYETYDQVLKYIENNFNKNIKETPFPLLNSEEIRPHLLKSIQKVYPDFLLKFDV